MSAASPPIPTEAAAPSGSSDDADLDEHAERLGRVALVTQGIVYVVVGLLAAEVARGDADAEADQTGALESVARQPAGRGLLLVLSVGLLAHAAWRLWLAAKGEPGDDDDAHSAAKRIANVGRAAIYLGFLGAAVRLLTKQGSSEGDTAKEASSTVLDWPMGPWIVVAAGIVGLAMGAWNIRKAVTRSFTDDLDMSRVDGARERWVGPIGVAGYLARGASFGLVGWFLYSAGRQHDAEESRGLDDALRELTTQPFGPLLLGALAVGLVAFGLFRVMDGLLRRPMALTRS